MRALVWHGGNRLALEEVPEPEPAPGETVVHVVLAGICGSDLHPYRGEAAGRVPPLVLGHEAIVRAADGSRAAIFPLISCGACRACLRGEPSLCERRVLVGLNRPGVFAERIAVPEGLLVPIPSEVPDTAAVLAEPLATGVAVIRQESIGPGSSVLVIGCGSIGLLLVHAAVQAGAGVIAADPVPQRRQQAARLGAERVFASAEDVASGTVDVAVDAVGAQVAWTAGVRAVRSGGAVVIVGLAQPEGIMPVGDLVRRGISVRGHYAYDRRAFETALRLLATSPPRLDSLTILPLEQGAEAFRRLVSDPGSAVKMLLSVHGPVEERSQAHSVPIGLQETDQPA